MQCHSRVWKKNWHESVLAPGSRGYSLIESFFRAVIRFRWLVITLVLGCTVLVWLQLGQLQFDSDVEAMVPFDDPAGDLEYL